MIEYESGNFDWHLDHLHPQTRQPRVALVFCNSSAQMNVWAKTASPFLFGDGRSSVEVVEDFQELVGGIIRRNRRWAPTIIPTHRLELMSNDVTRPDCIFVLQSGERVAKPIWTLTHKEIRREHKLQRLWLGGMFDRNP